MSGDQARPTVISFGPFEADLQTRELRKQGVRLRLPGQSFQILKILLERPGGLVTREELRQALWPSETFVDFEHGVNTGVNKLREALGDNADNPRYIETLPRRGYRFIGKLTPHLRDPEAALETEEPTQPPPPVVESSVTVAPRGDWLKIAAWIVFGAICAMTATFAYLRWRHTAEPTSLTAVPFTSLPGQQVSPTFSPDGSQIAFAWDGDPPKGSNGFDLYVKVIGSENLLRLTRHPAELICPTWSPDGTQIAFHRLDGANTGIYVVPALGGLERKLRSTRIAFGMSAPISWSPDGKWIAFADALTSRGFLTEEARLSLLFVPTLESKPLPHAARCLADFLPAFSHSGQDLAYDCEHSFENSEMGIYTVATAGGTPKLVTAFAGWGIPGAPAWTTHDEKLIFSHPHFGPGDELDEITLMDGSLRRLDFAKDASWPVVSSKGDKLAYVAYNPAESRIDVWRRDLVHLQAAAVKVISSTYEQRNAVYSPDGKHIAFESTRGGTREVWISDADGTHVMQISNFKHPVTGTPHWSPDSKKIVFDSRYSGNAQLYIADILERIPRRLVTSVSEAAVSFWSHDGKWIYFQSDDSGATRIYRCPATGGNATMLTTIDGLGAQESFDGDIYFDVVRRYTGFSTPAMDLYVQPARERVEQPVAVQGMPSAGGGQWTIGPTGIYFVPHDAPRSVDYFDFRTKRVQKLFVLDKDFGSGLSVSPDGRWILYSQNESETNTNIMLVEHFR
jgi:Tol biopolymer transport system component/DNA-binding winged helix-turn-helix (wHTH) protein